MIPLDCRHVFTFVQNLELQLHFFLKQKDKLKFDKRIVRKENSTADKGANCWFIGAHKVTRRARSQIYDHKSNSDQNIWSWPFITTLCCNENCTNDRRHTSSFNTNHHQDHQLSIDSNSNQCKVSQCEHSVHTTAFAANGIPSRVRNSAMQPWLKSSPTTT